MIYLAVFGLPAVVRYHEPLLHEYLLQSINSVEGRELELDQLPPFHNASQWVKDIYKVQLGQAPSEAQLGKISKKFTKRVKKYFMDEDESFEIRPGVQSIFGHMEKQKKWKYGIISPYWSDASHLILQTCGIFSKNKLTITADDALSSEDQLKIARKRAKKKNSKIYVYYVPGHEREAAGKYKELVQPPFEKGADNFFGYPRFNQLFPSAKK